MRNELGIRALPLSYSGVFAHSQDWFRRPDSNRRPRRDELTGTKEIAPSHDSSRLLAELTSRLVMGIHFPKRFPTASLHALQSLACFESCSVKSFA
jgi:hypothetical protein